MIVTVKQRPEEWKEESSANIWGRAVQPGKEDMKSLTLDSAFLLGVKIKVTSKSMGGSRRKKKRKKNFFKGGKHWIHK